MEMQKQKQRERESTENPVISECCWGQEESSRNVSGWIWRRREEGRRGLRGGRAERRWVWLAGAGRLCAPSPHGLWRCRAPCLWGGTTAASTSSCSSSAAAGCHSWWSPPRPAPPGGRMRDVNLCQCVSTHAGTRISKQQKKAVSTATEDSTTHYVAKERGK